MECGPHRTAIGNVGQITLTGDETISTISYWAKKARTVAIEFTTSMGTVYGPWGGASGEGTTLQVCKLVVTCI